MTNQEAIHYLKNGVSDEAIDMAIKALEKQATSEWIPCKERLPENNEWVLCTIDYGDIQVATVLRREGNSRWLDIDDWSYDFDIVTAWIPLPEPYEEGEQE